MIWAQQLSYFLKIGMIKWLKNTCFDAVCYYSTSSPRCCQLLTSLHFQISVTVFVNQSSVLWPCHWITSVQFTTLLCINLPLQLWVFLVFFQDKARYWPKITIFSYRLHLMAQLGGRHQSIAIPFSMQKLEWCGYPMVNKVWWYV